MHAPLKGRGAASNPANRYERLHLEPLEDVEYQDEEGATIRTSLFRDSSRTILARNDSPDVPFTYSINPYRGCEHGCIYCYARPSHEFLGFSAGLDFESKIVIKDDAARLLDDAFGKKSWQPQMVCCSGNTDCYQPLEQKLGLTRGCLAVFLAHRNPVGIITKNFLVTRDLDLLKDLAALQLVSVTLSITTLRDDLVRMMEPRTSMPARRLEAIRMLAREGVPVSVNVAPVVPGLTDEEIPAILEAAAEAGALHAGYQMMRLPVPVDELFATWVKQAFPDRAMKILGRVSEMHGGAVSDSRFGRRMKGEGEFAGAIRKLFDLTCARLGLNRTEPVYDTSRFVRESRQYELPW